MSLWLYRENNKLRDWKKCIYSTYSTLSSTHTYDFVVLTSLTHQRKIIFVVLQIGKTKNLSAPLRIHLSRYAPPITWWRDVQYIMYERECGVIKSRLAASLRCIWHLEGIQQRRQPNRDIECKQELQRYRQNISGSRTTASNFCGTLTYSGLQNGPISSLGVSEN
jgi:hypothetical protein